jgi:predicted ATPase
MLKSLAVKGFKSLVDTGPIEFAPVTVLFGPNGGGKSNVLDALSILGAVADADPLDHHLAFERVLRGRPIEQFTFGDAGLPGLIERDRVDLQIDATLVSEPMRRATSSSTPPAPWRYWLEIAYQPRTGRLAFRDLTDAGDEHDGGGFGGWCSYHLDPRVAMRAEQSPIPVPDIGPRGHRLLSYLFSLKEDHPREWQSVQRTLRALIPSVTHLDVRLDDRSGTLDLEVTEASVPYSARIVSDGTLRVLGLITALAEPQSSLVAFEEPENGVHPRRIELIARMLVAVGIEAPQAKQIVVTTHSPILCGAMIRHAREHPGQVALLRVVQGRGGTRVKPLDVDQPAFHDEELRRQLATVDDVSVFEGLVLRGLLDD